MAEAPEIKVKLTAEDTGVSAAIKELSSQLKNLKRQQDETAGSSISLSRAFAGIVAVAGTLQLARIGKDAFDSAVNIGKMADKTGLSTETLSVFHKVAGDVGVSTEAVDKALTKAAKSITELEQGSTQAAKGFALVGLKASDFAGLKPEQKIALVTDRLGKMSAGFAKTAAVQAIFSRGGAEMIPVLNSLAAQGFDKATEATSKLGLLLDQETTDSFRNAKASIQELEDVGKGMATQFEAGMLPAISDIGEGLADSLTQGGVSFKDLGKYAGDAVRAIVLIFLGLGQTLGTVAESVYDAFSQVWKEIKNEGGSAITALGEAVRGKFGEALNTLAESGRRSSENISDAVNRQKAIYGALAQSFKEDYANLFPTPEEEERRRKARIAKLRPEKTTAAPEVTAAAAPTDAAAKAYLALQMKLMEDQLAIHRAFAKTRAQLEKEGYDQGKLALAEYYEMRRAEILADMDKETAILTKGLKDAQAEGEKAAAKAKSAEPKEKDKLEAAHLAALAKVDELQTKITETQVNASTKVQALNAEEFKARQENQNKVLEFEKLIDTSAGKRREAAQAEIEIEKQKLAVILAQSGASQAEIDKKLAQYQAAKTAEVKFQEQQKSGGAELTQLADERAKIEDQVKNGKLFQVQADEEIRQKELERLPVLQQIAHEMMRQAQDSGGDDREQKIAQAADFQKQVDQIGVQTNLAGQQVAQLKQGLQTSLTGGFTQFFGSLVQGTQSVGQAFRGMAASVVSSLAQMAAQMLAQMIMMKLFKSLLGGFAGGGEVPGVGGGPGKAEGGLISGPGGPKSDSIPVRVSPGEYILNADAVSGFGLHNVEAINRGMKMPSIAHLGLPKFAEGGLVGAAGAGAGDSSINLGIGLDEGLVLKHLSSKGAANIILQHLSNNPKAASKALSRSS